MEIIKKFAKNKMFIPLLMLLTLLLYNAVLIPNFFTIEIRAGHFYGNLIDILKNVSPLALLSIGLTLVIATGGTDISVGSVIAISAAVSCSILAEKGVFALFGGSFFWAVFLGIASGVLCGIWNGILVAKVKLQPIIATLILLTAGRGIAQLITDGKIIRINQAKHVNEFYYLASGYLAKLPFSIFIVIFILIIVLLFVKRTAFGLFLESLGVNAKSSSYSGINVDRIKIIVFAISGFMAGVAGLLCSASIKAADANNVGLFFELDAILSVAIGGNSLNGGRFRIESSIIGALIIQTLTTTILAANVPPSTIPLVKAFVVLGICLIQSEEFRNSLKKLFRFKKKAVA